MVAEESPTAKPGRPASVTRRQILDAAAVIADDKGLDAVSFRALGAALGVSPMSIHRAIGGLDALNSALVSEIVGDAILTLSWGEGWREVARTFAFALRALLLRHPLVLEAHRRAPLEAPGADELAHSVVAALREAGLEDAAAVYAYGALHDFVSGNAAMRLGRGDFELLAPDDPRRRRSVFADHHDDGERFAAGVDIVLAGIASLIRERSGR